MSTATATMTATAIMSKGKRRRGKVRIGLARHEERKIKDHLIRPNHSTSVCSAAWADAHFREITDKSPEGEEITIVLFDPNVFPPRADTTPMRVCVTCGRATPPIYFGSDGSTCLDCHIGDNPDDQGQWGNSPMREVTERLMLMGVKELFFKSWERDG